jgi:hypothetical protein
MDLFAKFNGTKIINPDVIVGPASRGKKNSCQVYGSCDIIKHIDVTRISNDRTSFPVFFYHHFPAIYSTP